MSRSNDWRVDGDTHTCTDRRPLPTDYDSTAREHTEPMMGTNTGLPWAWAWAPTVLLLGLLHSAAAPAACKETAELVEYVKERVAGLEDVAIEEVVAVALAFVVWIDLLFVLELFDFYTEDWFWNPAGCAVHGMWTERHTQHLRHSLNVGHRGGPTSMGPNSRIGL